MLDANLSIKCKDNELSKENLSKFIAPKRSELSASKMHYFEYFSMENVLVRIFSLEFFVNDELIISIQNFH